MKTNFILFTLLLLFITSCKCDEPTNCEANSSPTNCTFDAVYEPVCGCNNVTYGNSCEAACAGITDYVEGECIPNCIAIPNDDCICPEIWQPVCGCDGVTYSNTCFLACAGIDEYVEGECD